MFIIIIIHIYIYIHIYTDTYTYIYIYIYRHIHISTYIYIYIYIYRQLLVEPEEPPLLELALPRGALFIISFILLLHVVFTRILLLPDAHVYSILAYCLSYFTCGAYVVVLSIAYYGVLCLSFVCVLCLLALPRGCLAGGRSGGGDFMCSDKI